MYFTSASKLTKQLPNCELKVSPLNKIKISSTPPAYVAHNGTKTFFLQYCQPAQNQPEFHFLFHKNSYLRDFNIMTLVTTACCRCCLLTVSYPKPICVNFQTSLTGKQARQGRIHVVQDLLKHFGHTVVLRWMVKALD